MSAGSADPGPAGDEARTFADLGVSAPVVAALESRGITQAFPIQEAVIEAALAGRDICGKAPTGSGKTLAFGVPAVDLCPPGRPWTPTALVLSPTRELATQIKDELEPLAKARSRTILTVFGGTNIERDIKRLEEGVDILVACPGRLEDLIARRCVELRDAHLVVVDEADRMADMGFLPSVKRILDLTPDNRHTLLFSATLDGDVDTLISRYQNDPLTFEIDEPLEGSVGDVEHHWHLIESHDRIGSAAAILRGYWSSIVFCRTRRGCDRVAKMLSKRDLAAVAIHGDRSQAQRERALRDFTSGKAQVLVATDVAARGIHVDDVELVMHYDPAGSDKDYIHRSGRTGRAGRPGRVISLVVSDKERVARDLQKALGHEVGFTDLDLDNLPPPVVIEARPEQRDETSAGSDKKRKPKPKGTQHDDQRGARRRRSPSGPDGQGGRGKGRDRHGGGKKRNERDERSEGTDGRRRGDGDARRARDDERDGRSSDRKRRGGPKGGNGRRDGRDDGRGDRRSGRGDTRNRRDGEGRDGGSGGTGRSPDRNRRGGGPNRGRDDRDGGRGNRNDGSRRGGAKGKGRDADGGAPRRRRRAANDWYPPGWGDDDEGRGGGSNTTQRKSRSSKGRHADRNVNRNKGRRRGPKKG